MSQKILAELLHGQNDVKQQASQINQETMKLFGKPEVFSGMTKTLSLLSEGADVTAKEAEERAGSSVQVRTTTVHQRLGYDSPFFIRMIDWELAMAKTNQVANADIVVDGKILASSVPGTYLIYLEKALETRRQTYVAAQVVPNTREVTLDSSAGKGVWKLKTPVTTIKNEKKTEYKEVSKATDKFPAQVQPIQVEKTLGTFETMHEYGMLTSAEKASILENLDKLIIAVKQSRARANQAAVVDGIIGKTLIDFIEAPLSK